MFPVPPPIDKLERYFDRAQLHVVITVRRVTAVLADGNEVPKTFLAISVQLKDGASLNVSFENF
jgi:hypothetical protein